MLIIAKKSGFVNCEYYHFGQVIFPDFLKHIISKEFEKVNPFVRLNLHMGARCYSQKNPLKSRTCARQPGGAKSICQVPRAVFCELSQNKRSKIDDIAHNKNHRKTEPEFIILIWHYAHSSIISIPPSPSGKHNTKPSSWVTGIIPTLQSLTIKR